MKIWIGLAFLFFMGVSVYLLLHVNIKGVKNLKTHEKTPIELQKERINSEKIKFENVKTKESYKIDENDLEKK